ncbi:MAG: hypothetical protein Q8N97_05195 [Methanobacteriaceae archaeon]|nr:hypothetical protein [Methanobacteriaceae archaeon]
MTKKSREIGINFLNSFDKYIAENINDLTTLDIFTMYFDFFEDLKRFKGNSNSFTGLGEYLLFRYLYNYLGGSFKAVPITKELFIFKSLENDYCIGQSSPITVESKKYYPDIMVYKNNEPFLVAEIKLYLTSGLKDLENDINKLKHIHKNYPNSKCLFICFKGFSKKGKIYKHLIDETEANEWLNYLILENEEKNLNEFFDTIL